MGLVAQLALAVALVLSCVPAGLLAHPVDAAVDHRGRALGFLGDLAPVAAAASGLLAGIANLGFAVSNPYGYGLYPPLYAPGLGGYYPPGIGYPGYPLHYAPFDPYV